MTLEEARAVLEKYRALEHFPGDEIAELGSALEVAFKTLDG